MRILNEIELDGVFLYTDMVVRGGHSVSAVPHYPCGEIDRSLL